MRKRKNVLVSVILIASMLATANPVYVLAEGFSDGEDAFSAGTEMEIQRMDDAAEFESGDSSDYFESADYPEAGAGELVEEYTDPENAETLVGEDASDGGVEINDTNFPDSAFQNYVTENIDVDRDGIIQQEEIDVITYINVTSLSISNLKGIEFFSNLTELYCGGNQLSSLDISSSIMLENLDCSGNKLSNLDLSSNNALTYLNCKDNMLKELDLSSNSLLTSVLCDGNYLNGSYVNDFLEQRDGVWRIDLNSILGVDKINRISNIGADSEEIQDICFEDGYISFMSSSENALSISYDYDTKAVNSDFQTITVTLLFDLQGGTVLPTVTPLPAVDPSPTATPITMPEPTPTSIPIGSSPNIKKAGTTNWVSHSVANITFTVSINARYYYEVYECADPNGSHNYVMDVNKAKTNVAGNVATTIDIKDFDEETASGYFDIVLYAVSADNQTDIAVFHIKNSTRPEDPSVTIPTPTPTTSFTPRIPSVTESIVRGLEKPLAFYPNTFYDFTVIGAGTDNSNPYRGDVKWVPIYWSMSSNPSEVQMNELWRIGAKNGITEAATYNMYIFFRKYEYDGAEWKAADTVEFIITSFRSQSISGISIDAGNFPDKNFRNYIKNNFDLNDNGRLDTKEISAVKTINVASESIKDLTGIAVFTNLKSLICYGNKLSSLDVSKNTKLERLDTGNDLYTNDAEEKYKWNQLVSSDVQQCLKYQNGNWIINLNILLGSKVSRVSSVQTRSSGVSNFRYENGIIRFVNDASNNKPIFTYVYNTRAQNKKLRKMTVILRPTLPSHPAVGQTFIVNNLRYKVNGTCSVSMYGLKNQNTSKVTIGSTVEYKGIVFNVTEISRKALYKNKYVTSVTIGSRIKTIGDYAFYKCTKLQKVTIGSGLAAIGKYVFYNDKKLSAITIKSTKLTSVKIRAFKGIYSKVMIKVPSKKLKTYKKLFKGKGLSSKARIVAL